jgi:hypothetical protein
MSQADRQSSAEPPDRRGQAPVFSAAPTALRIHRQARTSQMIVNIVAKETAFVN